MASAPRKPGDIIDIVGERQFDRLVADDYRALLTMRDNLSRDVELFTAAKKHLQRAHDARLWEVRALIQSGDFDSLLESDFRAVNHLLTSGEQTLALSRDAIAACPVPPTQPTAAAT